MSVKKNEKPIEIPVADYRDYIKWLETERCKELFRDKKSKLINKF
jgi:hypothetical protein